MKKIFLLFSMAVCYFSAYSAVRVTASVTPSGVALVNRIASGQMGLVQNTMEVMDYFAACTGSITGTSVSPYPVTPGPHTVTVTTTGNPTNMTFFNTTQGASISGYSYNASTGVGTCNFYATGMGTVRIGINLTDSCGNVTTTYVSW